MKKSLLIVSGVLLIAAVACNRTAFVKKLTGTWSLKQYFYAGANQTAYRHDTLMNQYKLVINEDQLFSETWRSLSFRPDTLFVSDTIGYDSATSMYLINHKIIPFVDTTIAYHFAGGRWDLLNSESDLQLTIDSPSSVNIYHILNLTGSELDIKSGNDEIHLSK